MKDVRRSVRGTLFFGLVAGMLLIPLWSVLSRVAGGPTALALILWTYLAGYGWLLSRQAKKACAAIVYPLLVLLAAALLVRSMSAYLVLSAGVLGWIRSGICFPRGLVRMLVAEAIFGLGGIGLIGIFSPSTLPGQAVAVWLFFLVQALYPALLPAGTGESAGEAVEDSFEQVCFAAEKILDD